MPSHSDFSDSSATLLPGSAPRPPTVAFAVASAGDREGLLHPA